MEFHKLSKFSSLVYLAMLSFSIFNEIAPQLVVKVADGGGDVIEVKIVSNISEDVVTVDYQKLDGTLITHFIDFQRDIQGFLAHIPPEEERGQTNYQMNCFVIRFTKNDFISSDAMSKLRQKNPGAVRIAEENKGSEEYFMDRLLNVEKSSVFSPLVEKFCKGGSVYMRKTDIKLWNKLDPQQKDLARMISATRKLPQVQRSCHEAVDAANGVNIPDHRNINVVPDVGPNGVPNVALHPSASGGNSTECACEYTVHMGWFPCGLKYCRGKDSTGQVVSYRCGIKTCRKQRTFHYSVRHPIDCIWME